MLIKPADANLLKLRAQVAEIVASQGGPTPAPSPENDRTQNFPAPQRSDVPSTTGQDFQQQNEKNAQDAQALLQQGDTAFNQGNTDQATTFWQQARDKGIGTAVFEMAQQRILTGHP